MMNDIESLSFPSLALQPNLKDPLRTSVGTIHSRSPVPFLLSVNFSPLPPPQLKLMASLSGSVALIEMANRCPGFAPAMSATCAMTGAWLAVGCGVGLDVERAVCDGLGDGVDCTGEDGLGCGVGAGVAGCVGAGVAGAVGIGVGTNVGAAVGASVGLGVGAAVGATVGLGDAAVGASVGAIVASSAGTGLTKRVRSGIGEVVGTAVGTAAGVGIVDVTMSGWLAVDSAPDTGSVARTASGVLTPTLDSGAADGAAHAANAAINSGATTNRKFFSRSIDKG
jgi:hypothetical protein